MLKMPSDIPFSINDDDDDDDDDLFALISLSLSSAFDPVDFEINLRW